MDNVDTIKQLMKDYDEIKINIKKMFAQDVRLIL